MASGSWALLEELYERGDPAFVAELRRIHDVERLGKFAARWSADKRPEARRLLADYLSLPLNAYRHEALVKRLFKANEKAGDDEVMGYFLVAFDRSVRRNRKVITRYKWEECATRELANQRQREWEQEGYTPGNVYQSSRSFRAYAHRLQGVLVAKRNTMPRPRKQLLTLFAIHDADRQRLEKRFVLFSLQTRRYLRRRAWRYFRSIGKTDPNRYRKAALKYLTLFTDADVDSDIHLLDNWGLMHTLFGASPILLRPARGFVLASGKGLSDLAPAPRFVAAWTEFPETLFELLTRANSRTVRQWAAWMLRTHQASWLERQPVSTCLMLIDHDDPDLMALGFDLLEKHADLDATPIETWLSRLDGDNLDRLQRLSALLERRLDPSRVPLANAVQLTSHRSLPVAHLGLKLLRGRPTLDAASVPELMPLVQAECPTLRAEIASWLRDFLMSVGPTSSEVLLEFLDSKHVEVRAVGWAWLQETPFKLDPENWQKLLETPYDDVKGWVVANLSQFVRAAEPDAIRLLWASTLLNLHGMGRHKPGVVKQIVMRLDKQGEDAERLLPLLTIVVRSLRGPEFRAGLSAVVSLFESKPELRDTIARQLPELAIDS